MTTVEFWQFLQALLILATTGAVVIGPPAVLIVRHRRRKDRDARAWRDAEAVATWEPHTDTDSTRRYNCGPHVSVEIRKVARRADTGAERVLDTFHTARVPARNDEFEQHLEAALDKARTICDSLNNARFAV